VINPSHAALTVEQPESTVDCSCRNR
jgi:hypothetical protein